MTWNIQWFTRLFDGAGQPLADGAPDADRPPQTRAQRLQAIADVLAHLDPAFIGLVEGPDSTNDSPTRSVTSVRAFAAQFGLPYDQASIGYRSDGQQEIVALWDSSRVQVQLDQGGGSGRSPAFDSAYFVDTDDDSVEERITFYRPPLEVTLTDLGSGTTASVIVCHNKSKGIFNPTDLVHWERESRRSRRLLMGQAAWIRDRVDERLGEGHNVIVMGDFNDGVGMDWYEQRFGRSSVETIVGDILEPDGLLRHGAGRPRWVRSKGAWVPASTSFKDRFTHDFVRVLIDFILVSDGLQPDLTNGNAYVVWNPYSDPDLTSAINAQLKAASDHFPVTIDLV
jgi:hypothetical protein